uniref:Uncharacterized protein n=1 Tax=Geospiza parvula TaxID=87175 RepID=A0A8C3NJL9_GEOPR
PCRVRREPPGVTRRPARPPRQPWDRGSRAAGWRRCSAPSTTWVGARGRAGRCAGTTVRPGGRGGEGVGRGRSGAEWWRRGADPRHVLGTGEEPGGARRAAEDGEARTVPLSAEEEEEEEEEERREPQPAAGGRRGARGFFGELRAELSAAGPAPPAPAGLPAVEVVVFRGRKRKERHSPSAVPAGRAQTQIVNEEKNAVRQEFNFEKARLEVHKFGITGYKKQEQRVWEQERAVMLGAKPPKKAHMNYRTYQEKLKEKKAVKDADKEKVCMKFSVEKGSM